MGVVGEGGFCGGGGGCGGGRGGGEQAGVAFGGYEQLRPVGDACFEEDDFVGLSFLEGEGGVPDEVDVGGEVSGVGGGDGVSVGCG